MAKERPTQETKTIGSVGKGQREDENVERGRGVDLEERVHDRPAGLVRSTVHGLRAHGGRPTAWCFLGLPPGGTVYSLHLSVHLWWEALCWLGRMCSVITQETESLQFQCSVGSVRWT